MLIGPGDSGTINRKPIVTYSEPLLDRDAVINLKIIKEDVNISTVADNKFVIRKLYSDWCDKHHFRKRNTKY